MSEESSTLEAIESLMRTLTQQMETHHRAEMIWQRIHDAESKAVAPWTETIEKSYAVARLLAAVAGLVIIIAVLQLTIGATVTNRLETLEKHDALHTQIEKDHQAVLDEMNGVKP